MIRSFTRKLALGAVVLGATLAACAKKEEAPPAPAATAPAKAEPLKAAFVYVGPVGDAGWSASPTTSAARTRSRSSATRSRPPTSKVPEGPDAERVIRDLVTQGNQVFATSFGFMDAMVKVAKDHPDVYFERDGLQDHERLFRVYEARFYEGAYLAGVVIAGKTTKTNTLGFVAPVLYPEVLRNINAFTLGAQSVNPKVKTRVVWINSWFDPPKETEAAQSLLNQGADVLLQNTDSTAVLQAAERNGKFAFGWDSDMSAFAPKAPRLGRAELDRLREVVRRDPRGEPGSPRSRSGA